MPMKLNVRLKTRSCPYRRPFSTVSCSSFSTPTGLTAAWSQQTLACGLGRGHPRVSDACGRIWAWSGLQQKIAIAPVERNRNVKYPQAGYTTLPAALRIGSYAAKRFDIQTARSGRSTRRSRFSAVAPDPGPYRPHAVRDPVATTKAQANVADSQAAAYVRRRETKSIETVETVSATDMTEFSDVKFHWQFHGKAAITRRLRRRRAWSMVRLQN